MPATPPADGPLGELRHELRALASEMQQAADGAAPPVDPLSEPPRFELDERDGALVFRIVTDNGGGPTTSHLVATEAEVRWQPEAGLSLRIFEEGVDASGLPPAVVVARLRDLCTSVVPEVAASLPAEAFRCAFCGELATARVERVISEGRRCRCGAIGLCSPQIDTDETIDDAINLFQVDTRESSRGSDAALIGDIRRSDIEIAHGWEGEGPAPGPWSAMRTLWFRRSKPR